MATDRLSTPGRFVWHELNTQDPEASRAFYGELFGWSFDMSNARYTHILNGTEPIGGVFKAPAPFIPTHWLPYISVADVDASAQVAISVGCTQIAGPMEVDAGRFIIVRDPQGALFQLWRRHTGDPPEVERPARGSFCWDQLNTPDPDTAFAVYAKIFGWTRAAFGHADSGMTTLLRGQRNAASMMRGPAGVPAHWLCYVVVDELSAARERATKLGGKVMAANVDVPGIGAFSVLQDPLGAVIAAFQDAG